MLLPIKKKKNKPDLRDPATMYLFRYNLNLKQRNLTQKVSISFTANKITRWQWRLVRAYLSQGMANCIKTLGAYYGRPTWFEKVFPSSRPWSVRTMAPPKLTLGTDLKTKFVTMTVLTVAAFVYIIFMLIYVKIVRLL
jgi:hypothetical protein